MPPCDVTSYVNNIKSTFSGMIFYHLSISDVKMNLSKIFQNFQNDRHFEVQTSFLTRSPNESWVQRVDSQSNSLHFELVIDVIAQM